MDYQDYLLQFLNIAMSRFKWINVPDNIDTRYLELGLMGIGHMLFAYDKHLDRYICGKSANGGFINFYDVPTRRRLYASNGYHRTFKPNNSVIIWNNYTRTPTEPFLINQAMRLWDMDRTADINVNAQKTPILIKTRENTRLTVKNLYKKFIGNEPVIFEDEFMDDNALKVLKTDAPFVADKVQELKERVWNETLTYLGISNVRYEKGERLITDEVQRMQGGTIACRNAYMMARENACREINELFGLNISVEFNEKVGAVDGRVHGDSEGDMRDDNGVQQPVGA